ncbi:hypothetical protein FGL97_07025 [Pseudomonas putida]|nr:hypothetical protein [Pseudomonas putida]NVN67987.1 hypothetical protein [Pseudomonas putida]
MAVSWCACWRFASTGKCPSSTTTTSNRLMQPCRSGFTRERAGPVGQFLPGVQFCHCHSIRG